MIGGVFVRPFNGCCVAIVGADMAHNFAGEVFDRTFILREIYFYYRTILRRALKCVAG